MRPHDPTNLHDASSFELPLRAQILCTDDESGAHHVLELVASTDFVHELAAEGYRVRLRAQVDPALDARAATNASASTDSSALTNPNER